LDVCTICRVNSPPDIRAFRALNTHRQAQKAITSGTAKTRYIYSGWQRIADYNGVSGALQNRYVYGINIVDDDLNALVFAA